MPIYEWRCGSCGLVFEEISSAQAAKRNRRCHQCGTSAARVPSSFAISKAASQAKSAKADTVAPAPRVPNFARLCGMDDFSAARMAAYKSGNGARFDDREAGKAERRKSRGVE